MKLMHDEEIAGNDYSAGNDILHETVSNPKELLKFMEGALKTLDSGNDYMDGQEKDIEYSPDECQRLKDPLFIDMTTGRAAICKREMEKSNKHPCDPARHRFRSSCGVCNNLKHRFFIGLLK